MLIQSDRHTGEDLELWAEYERADLIHAESPRMERIVEKSIEGIREFASSGPCYCGVSWGKDSVVAAHLVCTAARLYGLSIPLVWVRVEPIANPDCAAVRDDFLSRFQADYHEPEVWCTHDDSGWHATGTLESGFAEAERAIGTSRHISGIRADESALRCISVRHRGMSTANSCRPLANWTAQDVFAWLALMDLPVHPAYAMMGGGRWERQWIRVSSLGGERGTEFGRAEREREYYGDVLRRLEVDL
jgi:phosphoadenosine phosphosulfate reductase